MSYSAKSKFQRSWRDASRSLAIKKKTVGGKSTGNNKPERPKKWRKKDYKDLIWLILKDKRFWLAVACLFLVGTISAAVLYIKLSRELPDPNRLMERPIAQSTKIYDRTGENILYEIAGEQRRTLVSVKDIPEQVKWATIAMEDKNFYEHKGISYWAIFRTAVTNVLFGRKAGASTLTQQFVKNAVLTTEKRYTRKLKEAILAVKMEKTFSKDEILQMYFNEIPYGSTVYGIEAASVYYFGKHVQELNLAEAAILAAIPQAPSYYSPYGPNREALLSRQKYIIDLMAKYGYISQEEASAAKEEKIVFKEPSFNITAPHFVMYVKQLLEEKYGNQIEASGYKIYTTLDLYKQKMAEEIVAEYGETNEKYGASNAALLSIDPKNGQILAMVGSRDYYNNEIDGQVNITTSKRQPGSSMKPIVYAAAFAKGFTPNTIVYDVLTNFSNDPANPYEPRNYNGKENGPISLRKALAGSLNIPAVKTLYLAGMDDVMDLLRDLGYSTFADQDRFGLSLVLGGGEVKMLEHVNAFSAFARDGQLHPVTAILKIEDKDGNVLEEFKEADTKKVLDPQVARQVNDVLADDSARAYVFGAGSKLTLPGRPVAAKTGTTNDYRDAWTIGYTPSLVTGVWVGNNDNTEMKNGAAAATIAVPIWHEYMKRVLGDTPVEAFKKPEAKFAGKDMLDGKNIGEITVKIDEKSGLLATEYTPAEDVIEKKYRQDHCILYYVDKDDPLGDAPKNPDSDPQFKLWESRVLAWAEKQNFSTSTPPTEKDNIHTPENRPKLSIITPADNDSINLPFLTVRIEAEAPRGISRAEYYIDDNLVYVSTSYPYDFERQLDSLPKGFHSLKVRACDDVENCSDQAINFNLKVSGANVNESFSVSLGAPQNGAEIASSSFPAVIRVLLDKPEAVSRIEVYAIAGDGKEQLIASRQMIEAEEIFLNWSQPPAAGKYSLFAKALGWNGSAAESGRVNLIIN